MADRPIMVGDFVVSNGAVGTNDWLRANHPYAADGKKCRVLKADGSHVYIQREPDDTSGHQWSLSYLTLCKRKPTIII